MRKKNAGPCNPAWPVSVHPAKDTVPQRSVPRGPQICGPKKLRPNTVPRQSFTGQARGLDPWLGYRLNFEVLFFLAEWSGRLLLRLFWWMISKRLCSVSLICLLDLFSLNWCLKPFIYVSVLFLHCYKIQNMTWQIT